MSKDANEAFAQVRQNIDSVDNQLVELLAERLALTSQVGQLKAKLDLPLYVPSREAELIAQKRHLAVQKNISPDLVEDVIRRIMRESYASQDMSRSQVSKDQQKKIVVIGGQGQLGSLFVRLFRRSGYQVDIIEENDWEEGQSVINNASLVMVAVPIRVTNMVIEKLSQLNQECLLVDITSIKDKPLQSMLKVHKGPVVGLHPMFGPGIKHLAKQTIVVCHGRDKTKSQWFIELLKVWGANLSYVDAKEHDRLMSIVQVLRHFSTVAYGFHLNQEGIDLDKVLELSSPIYRLELIMVGRLFAQDAELYSDIIFSDKQNIPMIKRFLQRLTELLEMLETNDKKKFAELFEGTSKWFGENANKFLQESNRMLAKAGDLRR